MGNFPLSTPNPPHKVATIDTISILSQQSPISYDRGVVPSPFDISSLLHISPDHIPLPSSSFDTHNVTTIYELQRTKIKRGRHRKLNPNKKDSTSEHNTSHPPLASVDHAGVKLPTSGHHVGKKPTNIIMLGHGCYTSLSSIGHFSISSSLKIEVH